ncbi:MAG: hypothetical protein KDH96_05765, partial [Candidatus Riesia sp.]|nr:hypothetical protein [Candidatus Riesia sp.]
LMFKIHSLACECGRKEKAVGLAELCFTSEWDIGTRLVTISLSKIKGLKGEVWCLSRADAPPSSGVDKEPPRVEMLIDEVDLQTAWIEFQLWCLNAVTEDTKVSLAINKV